MMLILGLEEFQKGRKVYGYRTLLFLCFSSSVIFIA